MSTPLEIAPVARPVRGSIRPPGSKSLTNRALIVAALADGPSRLTGVLDSDDTRVMVESLRRLGHMIHQDQAAVTIEFDRSASPPLTTHHAPLAVYPGTHVPGSLAPGSPLDLWLENSGTSIRFLTALCALRTSGPVIRLDGNARMRERPIQPLVDALNQWGGDVASELGTGCPPVLVRPRGLPGGTVRVSADLSSQYLSALLMAAPRAAGDVRIKVEGPLVSRPYVDMTLSLMRQFGSDARETEPNVFVVQPRAYQGRTYDIEPDASAASYFFAAAAVTGGAVTVEGLSRDALQGDVEFAAVLQRMGCRVIWGEASIIVQGGPLHGIDVEMNAVSDTAQTLAAVAPFAKGPTRIRGVAHMRHKETDRVAAVVTELRRLGLQVDEHADGLTIHPGPMRGATIETYHDHRMAMSFAVLGLRQPGVKIADPGCTSKTYPNFFADLDALCEASR